MCESADVTLLAYRGRRARREPAGGIGLQWCGHRHALAAGRVVRIGGAGFNAGRRPSFDNCRAGSGRVPRARTMRAASCSGYSPQVRCSTPNVLQFLSAAFYLNGATFRGRGPVRKHRRRWTMRALRRDTFNGPTGQSPPARRCLVGCHRRRRLQWCLLVNLHEHGAAIRRTGDGGPPRHWRPDEHRAVGSSGAIPGGILLFLRFHPSGRADAQRNS